MPIAGIDNGIRAGISGPTVAIVEGQRHDKRARVTDPRARSAVAGLHRPLSREESIREAVLWSFCDPLPDRCTRLLYLSSREWQRLLKWLDISGLALYFFDRMAKLDMLGSLPAAVIDRLEQNLIDNARRTEGMIDESIAIQRELQRAGVSYAVTKGFSLGPSSVPRQELRHQFDLDFLIAEKWIGKARQILEYRGYRLYAVSGRSWEFKANERPVAALADLYKDLPGRSVELHVEAEFPNRPSMLGRTSMREFNGIDMPVLSPVDLFLAQGMHVYKDICSEFLRVSHLLEFRRHVVARRNDSGFWDELRRAGEADLHVRLGLGTVVQVITHVMGPFAPEELVGWTVGHLPASVSAWIDIYGRRAILKSFPGNKSYLLLQQELAAAGLSEMRPLRQALLPSRFPPALVRSAKHEGLPLRVRRYRLQLRQICGRMRFHVVEGIRYAWDSRRWQKHMNRVGR